METFIQDLLKIKKKCPVLDNITLSVLFESLKIPKNCFHTVEKRHNIWFKRFFCILNITMEVQSFLLQTTKTEGSYETL